MKTSLAIALTLTAIAPSALAQSATPAPTTSTSAIKKGTLVSLADGRHIGRVDRVRDGHVGIIYNGRYVLLPASSLTTSDHGLVTSLTKAELSGL